MAKVASIVLAVAAAIVGSWLTTIAYCLYKDYDPLGSLTWDLLPATTRGGLVGVVCLGLPSKTLPKLGCGIAIGIIMGVVRIMPVYSKLPSEFRLPSLAFDCGVAAFGCGLAGLATSIPLLPVWKRLAGRAQARYW